MDLFHYFSYRDYLADELKQRKISNQQYSQRAYARDLDLAPSRLSEVLNKKGHLNAENALLIAQVLFDSESEVEYFTLLRKLVIAKCADQKLQHQAQLAQLRIEHTFNNIDFGHLKIQQWYHIAILFILKINSQIPASAIARYLKLDITTVEKAISQLVGDNFISPGTWSINPEVRFLKSPENSKINQAFHRALISKSLDAMLRLQAHERYFKTYLFTINSENYQRIIQLIDELSAAVGDQGSNENHNSVFCFSCQLFPIATDIDRQ